LEFREHIRITEKSKTNFLISVKLLSKEKKDALKAVYAFCRILDDIVDESNISDDDKKIQTMEWRNTLENYNPEHKSNNVLINYLFESAINKYKIQLRLFTDIIKGMEMDLTKKRYNNIEELLEYCYYVASTIGLIFIKIIGYKNIETEEYAHKFGIALQITNIIRDIKKDAEKGRIYLPLDELKQFNYSEADLFNNVNNESFRNLIKYQINRVKIYFNDAEEYLFKPDRQKLTSARIISKIYYDLLLKIEKNDFNIYKRDFRISGLRKLTILLGAYIDSIFRG
jgi:phytoene synthase